jgi:hypothetical protein
MTNRQAIATALAILGNTFDRKLTPPAVEGFNIALGDLTETELAAATKRALLECKFMPAPSEFRAFARPPRDLARETALAWEAVRRAMDAHDYTASVDFGPLVNAVVRNLGGWQALCAASVPDLVWRRKDFERVYALFAPIDPSMLHGAPLRGALNGPILVVEIEGQPSSLRALPEASSETRLAAAALVRELADGKTLAGAAPEHAGSMPARAQPGSSAGRAPVPPLRETKPKAPPLSPAEVEARKAEIAARFAARGVTPPAAPAETP